ncbi:MAG TPA: hypothetical protein VE987_12975 [Polyangiaceae bacterium]|nr:hypothetical protein [Polyangiaceae bacterium]
MNSPAEFDPAARAHLGLVAFWLFALDAVRERARQMPGPVCCVSVLTHPRRSCSQTVQLTACAPPTTQRELAELFRSLPPRSTVAWFPGGPP